MLLLFNKFIYKKTNVLLSLYVYFMGFLVYHFSP